MKMALNNFFFLAFMLLLSFSTPALASDGEYNPNPNLQKTNPGKEKLLSTMIGIQGLVYCRSGSKLTPLEDAKGYFIATLSPHEVKENRRLKECKAFLELSPSETCDVPTNVNKGISGAPLGYYHLLHDKNMKLFSVGPFFFISQQDAKSNSDGH
ncbi:hypothetical protein CRYUN_Cryun23aG0103200 [Craigia yunnanensis]